MSEHRCPTCHNPVAWRRMYFQCVGRPGQGGYACPPVVDEVRARFTGFSEAKPPVFAPNWLAVATGQRMLPCPWCKVETGVRVCPSCHTELPTNFGAGPSAMMTVYGAIGAGKTVYLQVLEHELTHRIRQRFDADVHKVADVQSVAEATPATPGDTVHTGQFPPATARAELGYRRPELMEWRAAQAGWPHQIRSAYLSLYDTAGEQAGRAEEARGLTHVAFSDAFILLLDSFMVPNLEQRVRLSEDAKRQRAEQVLGSISTVIRAIRETRGISDGPIPIPVAVALTKIDEFYDLLRGHQPHLLDVPEPGPWYDETHGALTHEYVRALLRQFGADEIDARLSMNFSTYRYFVVSSLGTPPTDYTAGARTVDPAGVRPFRVDEPLLWLMSLPRFDIVRRVSRPR